MELTPEQTVFGIAELVNKIFSFVDTKSLCNARQVCHNWREISKMSLKRRVQLIHVDEYVPWELRRTITLTEHEHDRKLIIKTPREIRLTVKDVLNPMDQFDESKITRCTALLITVLEQDWLGSVVSLGLDRCLTVDEWNAAGCRILSKFPVMESVRARMVSSSVTPGLSLWCAEMKNDEVDWTSGFKCLRNVILTGPVIDHGDESEPNRICLDIFDHCSNLRNISVNWNLQNTVDEMQIKFTDNEDYEHFGCTIFDGMFRNMSNTCAQAIMKDLAKVMTVTKPERLTLFLPCHPDLASTIASSVSAELHTVVLDIGALEEQKQEPVGDGVDNQSGNVAKRYSAEDLLLPFFSTTAFANVKKLKVDCHRFTGQTFPQLPRLLTVPFPKVAVVDLQRGGRYSGVLSDSVLDRWMQDHLGHLGHLAPNAQLLFVSFGMGTSRLTALKLAKNFPSLKHLVLLDENFFRMQELVADLDVTEIQCLQGLKGITLITELSIVFENYILAFVKACGSVSTIRKLSVHCCQELDREINLNSLGINIPENLTVETRSIARDRGKIALEGVEDSMLTWEAVGGGWLPEDASD